MFEFFEADLASNLPEQAGGFVCPLCLQRFLVLDTKLLNRAHLWPESLGGRIYTLACQKCNSRIGSSIEKHEVERVKYLSLEKLPLTEKTEGVKGQISLLCSLKDTDGQPVLVMEISDKQSNPLTLAESKRLFDSKEISRRKVTLSYRGKFNERKANLTYLHFAYMSLFHLTGYPWVKTAQAVKIRAQLNKPKETIFPILFTELERKLAVNLAKPDQPILFEVEGVTALQGYFVATPELSHSSRNRLGVWIPKHVGTIDMVLSSSSLPNENFSLKYLAAIRREPGLHTTC